MKAPLRIGLLCDYASLPTYLFEALKKLSDEGKIDIVVACINQNPASRSWWLKISYFGRVVAELLYRSLSKTSPITKLYPLDEIKGNIQSIFVTPISTRLSDQFKNEDLKKIESFNCDFLIRNGFKILRGGILSAAKHGVLSFHHGDNQLNRGGPPLYWEFSERWDNAGAILQRLTEVLDGGQVLDRGYSNLVPWDYWLSHNNLTDACTSMLYRFIDTFDSTHVDPNSWTEQVYDKRLYKSPPNWLGLWHAIKFLCYFLCTTIKKLLCKEKWEIYIGNIHEPMYRYHKFQPPKGEFWADPFLYERDNNYYVFYERYIYREGVGRLSVFTLDHKLKLIENHDVMIGEDCHLSFPHPIVIKDHLYLLPEISSKNELALYRCVKFPDQYEKAHVLLGNTCCVDSSLIKYRERWWLFTSHSVLHKKAPYELHLYSSANPLSGNWEKHPQCPIYIDVRCGRNAGQVFQREGKLYRTAQDGTQRYGRRIAIYEVVTMDQAKYQEKLVRYIEPDWCLKLNRCHTFNAKGHLAVLDAAKDVFAPFL